MDRRQFLNTPHLIGVSAVLPATVVFNESPSAKTSIVASLLADSNATIQLCKSIANSVTRCDLVGIDIQDLLFILSQEGDCAFGFGSTPSVNGAQAAARQAIDHPFLGQRRLQQSSAALVAIEAPPQVTRAILREAKIAMNYVRAQMLPNPYIIYGVTVNPDRSHEFMVSILASGIQKI